MDDLQSPKNEYYNLAAMKTLFTTNQISRIISKYLLPGGLLFTRNLSRGFPKLNLNLVVIFDNAAEQKEQIFLTCKDKSFVYRWVNKINGKDYLGSTSNAKSRLSQYYDHKTLSIFNMPIAGIYDSAHLIFHGP